MESRWGLLGKHEKEWREMGIDDGVEWVERGVLKRRKCWSVYR